MYDEDDAWSKQRPRCAYQIVQNFTNVCREEESSDKSVFFYTIVTGTMLDLCERIDLCEKSFITERKV